MRLALLFGSTARGTARTDSDLDVAIVPADPDLPLAEELALEARLEHATGRPVEVVRADRAARAVAWRIARDGIVLFADSPHAASRFRARIAIEHGDDAELRADAARRFRAALARSG
ncbi:MAG: nucleotidyltransferase domain-containing protein [Deltaproteobacteria bacterium]|nr:nucleotidyltransferase domain-containing protein [Deltaproteobacteria bacterium]